MDTKSKFLDKYIWLIGCVLLIGILMGTGYSYFKQALNLGGTTTIAKKEIEENKCSVSITKTYRTWSNGDTTTYDYSFEMTNKRDEPMYFWTVYFDIPDDATVTSSASEYKIENGKLYLSSISYNSYLDKDATVTFGAAITTSYEFNIEEVMVSNCDISENNQVNTDIVADITTSNSWGTYTYQYDIVLKNKGTTDIKAWKVNLEVPEGTKILNIWGANYVIKGTILSITNLAYNGAINVDGTISLGMQLETNIESFTPKVISVVGN